MGERRYSSTVLELCTRWRWVISFTPCPLYPQGNIPRCPLDRMLDGPQSRFGCCRVDKSISPAENRTATSQPVAIPNGWSHVDIFPRERTVQPPALHTEFYLCRLTFRVNFVELYYNTAKLKETPRDGLYEALTSDSQAPNMSADSKSRVNKSYDINSLVPGDRVPPLTSDARLLQKYYPASSCVDAYYIAIDLWRKE
jgi:hypothetical protein